MHRSSRICVSMQIHMLRMLRPCRHAVQGLLPVNLTQPGLRGHVTSNSPAYASCGLPVHTHVYTKSRRCTMMMLPSHMHQTHMLRMLLLYAEMLSKGFLPVSLNQPSLRVEHFTTSITLIVTCQDTHMCLHKASAVQACKLTCHAFFAQQRCWPRASCQSTSPSRACAYRTYIQQHLSLSLSLSLSHDLTRHIHVHIKSGPYQAC
jgi:hypothetical protein